MHNLIDEIPRVPKEEITDLVMAAIERYRELFPDWDIFTFSLDRRLPRNEQIDQNIRLLETLKTFPE